VGPCNCRVIACCASHTDSCFAGKKIGGAIIACIDFWEHITTVLTPFEPTITVAVGLVGAGGFSLLLAMATDVLVLATVHIYALYSQFAWLHSMQLSVLASFWKLFRGRKHNVLRSRVDSIDFDLAQLLLGTMLFCVVFFLFPTTLVYYCFFLVVWLAIACVRTTLWWLITLLNNMSFYTLFALLALPSSRFPSGIVLQRIGERRMRRDCTMAGLPTAIGSHGNTNSDSQSCNIRSDDVVAEDHVTTVWFELQSASSPPGLALSPYFEALRIVLQQYSFGALLKAALWGRAAVFPLKGSRVKPVTRSPPTVGASGMQTGATSFMAAGMLSGCMTTSSALPVNGAGNDVFSFGGILDYWSALREASQS
jgi:hypothetical protein